MLLLLSSLLLLVRRLTSPCSCICCWPLWSCWRGLTSLCPCTPWRRTSGCRSWTAASSSGRSGWSRRRSGWQWPWGSPLAAACPWRGSTGTPPTSRQSSGRAWRSSCDTDSRPGHTWHRSSSSRSPGRSSAGWRRPGRPPAHSRGIFRRWRSQDKGSPL